MNDETLKNILHRVPDKTKLLFSW